MDDPHAQTAVCRLFPLLGVVLFPHVVLPLHIFEPRYRQMTEHALAGDQLIAMVQHAQRPPSPSGVPAIESVACLGEILSHERLPDGRFNLLLVGKHRIRLTHEIPASTLYRQARYTIIPEVDPQADDSPLRSELITGFRAVASRSRPIDPDLDALLNSDVPLSVLSDILAHALALPAPLKQVFLAEPDAEKRAAGLVETLRQMVPRDEPRQGRTFPPEFSVN